MSNDFDFSHLNWRWVFISMLIFFVAQIIISIIFGLLGLFTLGIGFLLFIFLKPAAYFASGFITGYISPGITIKEPAIGAVIISLLGTLFEISRHRSLGLIGIIIAGLVAFFCALFGAKLGEKYQNY